MMLTEKAFFLALRAHEGQVRKHDQSPYIVHPVAVALILARHGFSQEVVSAGLVHDVLEDTSVTEQEVRTELGGSVTDMVRALSEDKTLPWKERKAQYIEVIRSAPDEVKAVSIADKIHNLSNLLEEYEIRGADLWKLFNAGREDKQWFEESLYDMFRASWNHALVEEYGALVERLRNLV